MENAALVLKSSGYGSGYGSGSGYGYGDGDGSGSGYGFGDGSGYGDGDGYGSGDGDGDGYGSGSGYGDGSGYGFGDGSGYGDGDGDGDGDGYFAAILEQQNNPETIGLLAFWKSSGDGQPCNGGSGQPASVGLTETVDGPLTACTKHALHGTANPSKWKGERWWIVLLHEPWVQTDGKFASLKRTILKDLGKCPFNTNQ